MRHRQRQLGVNSERFRDGIVGKGVDQDVLSTEVAEDVRLIQLCLRIREEAVLIIGLAIAERHFIGVDFTAEVAFGGCDFDAFKVLELSLFDLHFHSSYVINKHRNGVQRHVG